MGGTTEPIATALKESYTENASLEEAVKIAVEALRGPAAPTAAPATEPRSWGCRCQLEVAILDVNRPRRAFRRITGPALEPLLPEAEPPTEVSATAG